MERCQGLEIWLYQLHALRCLCLIGSNSLDEGLGDVLHTKPAHSECDKYDKMFLFQQCRKQQWLPKTVKFVTS